MHNTDEQTTRTPARGSRCQTYGATPARSTDPGDLAAMQADIDAAERDPQSATPGSTDTRSEEASRSFCPTCASDPLRDPWLCRDPAHAPGKTDGEAQQEEDADRRD